jgi:hypothetical protein
MGCSINGITPIAGRVHCGKTHKNMMICGYPHDLGNLLIYRIVIEYIISISRYYLLISHIIGVKNHWIATIYGERKSWGIILNYHVILPKVS